MLLEEGRYWNDQDAREPVYYGIIEGFKTAQALNDKCFSLKDMEEYLKLYRIHIETDIKSKSKWIQTPSEFIQSLQKTEWDVEVNELNQITKLI